MPPSNTGLTFDVLLRDRKRLLERIESDEQLRQLIRVLLMTIAFGTGAFGAVLGVHKGGIQILFAAIKLPLVSLATAAICAPALTAANASLGRPANLRRDIALVLSALATGSLALAALAPIVLFGHMMGLGYHRMVLLAVACCGVGGAFGLWTLVRGMVRSSHRGLFWALGTLMMVFGLVGSQMAWTMRPYLLRPAAQTIPFVRAIEGSFVDSVFTTMDSASGIYRQLDYELEYR